jgi:large subunit ribosomal protein L4
MPEKKPAAQPKKATSVRKTESEVKSKAEANAKAAAKATVTAKAGAASSGKAADSGSDKRKIEKKAAAPRRAVARPVTRVVRPEAERAARAARAAEPRPKREKPAARPIPTAPAGQVPVIAADGSVSGSMPLPAAFSKVNKNIATLFQAFMAARANARQATSATKNRSRVSGGGKKPYAQKGTGRARAGSTRSPLWRHGGVVFGPNGRQYWQRLPEKMRRAAFADAVGTRAAEGRFLVVEGMKLEGERARTRDAAAWLGKLGDTGTTVFVWNEIDENAARAMANLPEIEIRTPSSLRLTDVLVADTMLVMRPALDALIARTAIETKVSA